MNGPVGAGEGDRMNAVMDLVALNSAEKKLVKAAAHDTIADLRVLDNGERPVIHAVRSNGDTRVRIA